MATRVPAYTDSDSDSEYGFNLTVDEEELIANLVAKASSQESRLARAIPTASRSPNVGALLETDVKAAFATHTGVKSPSYDELGFDAALHDRAVSLNGEDRLSPSVLHGDASLATAIDKVERSSIPGPLEEENDISYPDLSNALADVLDTSTAESKDKPEPEPRVVIDDPRPPLARFRSFPRKPLSVSDIISGAWCELQYYYTLTMLPGGRKTRTAAMRGGTKLHKQLEEQVYTTVKVDIEKKEDVFGLKLWNIIQGLRTLRDTGMTREMETWGLVDGQVVNGVIDGLTYENPDPDFEEEIRSSQGSQNSQETASKEQQKITNFFGSDERERNRNRQIYLFDVKTRGSSSLPSGAALRPTKIQLFLYHRFLSNMAAGKLDFMRVFARYGLGPDEPFSDSFMAQIGSLHDEIFSDAVSWAASKGSGSNYVSASSTPPSPSVPGNSGPDLIHYQTLRELIPLLRSELRLTFPRGADSIGSLVTVEYRRRRREKSAATAEADRNGLPGQEGEDDVADGEVIGQNVFYVDDDVLDRYLAEDMQWWRGKRKPRGVVIEEAYKCRGCEFAAECTWRMDQEAVLLKRARARRPEKRA